MKQLGRPLVRGIGSAPTDGHGALAPVPRVLDSSGPRSPKPARIYANPRVRPRLGAPRRPHGYAVSGASTPRLRLPENRGVPSSILGLAISPFFCGRGRAVLGLRRGWLSASRVQFTVLNVTSAGYVVRTLIGGRELGEVDPSPGHGDRRERDADGPGARGPRPRSGRARWRRCRSDDDRQVVQRLKRRRGTVRLERIPTTGGEAGAGVRAGVGGGHGCPVSRVERESCGALAGDGRHERRSRLRTAAQTRRYLATSWDRPAGGRRRQVPAAAIPATGRHSRNDRGNPDATDWVNQALPSHRGHAILVEKAASAAAVAGGRARRRSGARRPRGRGRSACERPARSATPRAPQDSRPPAVPARRALQLPGRGPLRGRSRHARRGQP
jgi:hypothetical protein